MLIAIIAISILAAAWIGLAIWFWIERNESQAVRGELKSQLHTAEKDKDDALWQLYLSEVSLLASVSALYNERRRFHDLKEKSDLTVEEFREFHENVKTRAQRRLIRKGNAVALSFIPGLGLLDILGDLGETLEETDGVSEFVKNMSESIDKLATSPTNLQFNETTNDDDISLDLMENAHKTFNQWFDGEFLGFDENAGSFPPSNNVMVADASGIKVFVDNTIQSTQDLEPIKSMTKDEIQKVIARTLNKVHQFAEAAGNRVQPETNATDQ